LSTGDWEKEKERVRERLTSLDSKERLCSERFREPVRDREREAAVARNEALSRAAIVDLSVSPTFDLAGSNG